MPLVEIAAMSFGRFGIGRLDGKTVLTPATAPGDLVEVQVVEQHRDYLEALPVRVVRGSSHRRAAPCPYVPRCGGCDWQHIEYGEQLRAKAQLVANVFSHALNIELDHTALVEPAPFEFGYRSRLRLQIGPHGEVGFYHSGTRNVVEVSSCLIAVPQIQLEIARQAARLLGRCCREVELAADAVRQVITLRLRRAAQPHEIQVAQHLLSSHDSLSGVILRAEEARVVIGNPAVTVELEPGLAVEVDADCFSQVNHALNQRAVVLVIELARAGPGASLLDLYCGAGNFALPLARRGAEVVGVDLDRWAVACAERNAKCLGIDSARFLAMPAQAAIQFLRRARYRPSTVILDPPRAGAANAIDEITELRAERVIYVSCNLPMLGRDLRRLSARGYRCQRVRAFDFFPNTHYVEVIAEAVLT
jgi:23S rRNA (uracil1939-C5)-methyltransferase